jgi:hypothetical protein
MGHRFPPKTSFGPGSTVTLSTRACRGVLDEIGMTEEMLFEMYQRAVQARKAERGMGKDELVKTVQQQQEEIERLRQELEKALEQATAPTPRLNIPGRR